MQTTAGETRGPASGMADDGGGGGGRGTANEGFGEEKTWHALFDRLQTMGTTQWSQVNGLSNIDICFDR
jgi:hypothetical protein